MVQMKGNIILHGIDLKISSIFRTKYGEYPEYHTSLDNFNLVTTKGCLGGFNVARKSKSEILLNRIYPKCKIMCEPQMGKEFFTRLCQQLMKRK